MYFVDSGMVAEYMENDSIVVNDYLLYEVLKKPEFGCVSSSQTGLLESEAKRFITSELYSEVLPPELYGPAPTNILRRDVLDVGGGINSVSLAVQKSYDYILLDSLYEDIDPHITGTFWCSEDWAKFKIPRYDIVIANDLFPNVDQRLEKFLDTYLPKCYRIFMSLTVYDNKSYQAKRLDGTEVLTVKAGDT